jgi:hypothetical protein
MDVKPGPLIDTMKINLQPSKGKFLRKIYDPICDNGRRRIRYNNELYQLFGEPDIIKETEARRLRWLGHLFRINENHPCRKLTFTTLHGSRRVRRLPTR